MRRHTSQHHMIQKCMKQFWNIIWRVHCWWLSKIWPRAVCYGYSFCIYSVVLLWWSLMPIDYKIHEHENVDEQMEGRYENYMPPFGGIQIKIYKLITSYIPSLVTHLLSTFKYSLVYIPFPGPPAEKEPPPPIIILRTQKATKSSSLCEQLSNPITKWASSGIGVGPRLTFDKSFSTWNPSENNDMEIFSAWHMINIELYWHFRMKYDILLVNAGLFCICSSKQMTNTNGEWRRNK